MRWYNILGLPFFGIQSKMYSSFVSLFHIELESKLFTLKHAETHTIARTHTDAGTHNMLNVSKTENDFKLVS